MKKKLSKEMSAGTTDDSSTNADDMQVSPAIAKPNVVRSPNSVSTEKVDIIPGYLPSTGKYDTTELDKELDELRLCFTVKLREIRKKYFSSPYGVIPISNYNPNDKFDVGFIINLGELRDNNVTLT